MAKLPNKLIWAIIILAFIGLLDATYLTVSHYSGASLNCSFTNGCDTVTASEYSVIFGVPVALLGTIFYFIALVLSLLYFDTRKALLLKILAPLATGALLFSAYFVYLQLVVIQAICQYCMLSAATSTLIFVLTMVSMRRLRA